MDGDGDGAIASPVQGPATNWEVFHFSMSSVAPLPYVTTSSSSSSTLLYHESPVTVAARDQFVGSFRNQGQLSAAMALQSKLSDMMTGNSGASHGIWPSPPGQLNGGSGPFPPNLAPDPGFAERAARLSSFNGGGGGGVMRNSGLAPTFSLPSDLGNMTRSSPSRSHTSSPHRPPHLGGGGGGMEPHLPPLHYHHHYPRQLSRSMPSSPTFANSSSRINPFLLPTQHYQPAGTPPDLPRHEPPTLTASLDLASGPLAAAGFRSAALPPTTEAAPALTSAHINAAPSALYASVGQDTEILSLPAAEQEPHSSAATRASGGKKRKVGLKGKFSSKSAVVQKNADGAGGGGAEAKRCKGASAPNVELGEEAINCETMAMGVELAGEQSNTINHEEDSAASGSALKENSSITAMTPDPPKQLDYIHVRARRGQATDSHSLAERVRREKISDRMKFLQDLVPGCNKVTGKAVMLDEIINYVQSLQRQVEFLSMKLSTVSPTSKLEGLLSNGTVLMSELQSQNLQPNKMMALLSNYGAPTSHLPADSHHLVNHHQHQTTDLDHAEPLQPTSTAAPYINEHHVPLPLLLDLQHQHPQTQAWEDELQSIVQMGFPTLS